MRIDIAHETDIEALADVEVQSKLSSFPELLAPHDTDIHLRVERWRTYFAGTSPQGSHPQRIVLKAVNEGGQIVGYISGHLSTRFGLDAEIQSFYILKEFQRTGLGGRLLAQFKNWLLDQNAQSLCVGIDPRNPYQQFYLKHGGAFKNEHWIVWDPLHKLM